MSPKIRDEFESLRQSLDRPRSNLDYNTVDSKNLIRDYKQAIDTAEIRVERLAKDLNAAKDGYNNVDESLQTIVCAQLSNRDEEIKELKRLIAVKETSIESLRDALSSTKSSSESKLARLQQQLRDAQYELSTLKDDLRQERKERMASDERCQTLTSSNKKREKELGSKEQELWTALQSAQKEHARTLEELDAERNAHKQTRSSIKELRSRVDQERKRGHEVTRLKRILHEEREQFAKAKKWLKAELKSRDEMEQLLVSLKDVVCGSPIDKEAKKDPETEVYEEEDGEMSQFRADMRSRHEKLCRDGAHLKAQLNSTRKKLSKALEKGQP